MYQPIYPMVGMPMPPTCYYCMMSGSPISYGTMMQPETFSEPAHNRNYEDVDEDEDEVKEYKLTREGNSLKEAENEQVDTAQTLSPENKGYRWMKEEDDSNIDRGVSHVEPPSQDISGMPEMTNIQGHQGKMPENMQKEPKMNPAEILRMIETHHPEIIRTFTSFGIPENTARQLATRIIEVTLMHSM